MMTSGLGDWWSIGRKKDGVTEDVCDVDSVEELFTCKCFDGKCINEIFDEIRETIDVN